MASERTRIRRAGILRNMSWDYGIRAARALDICVPSPHRDKRIARALNVSIRTVQYLRTGKHWTTERLNQASAAFAGFDRLLASKDEIDARIDDIEQELSELRRLVSGANGDE